MNNNLPKILLSFIFFFLAGISLAKPVFAAPNLSLSPTSQTAVKNTEYQLTVTIDVESNQAFGADVILVYPSADIDVTQVTTGGFFPEFTSSIVSATGRVEMHSYFSSLYEGKTGSGTFATIKYKPKKDTGSGTVSFSCSGNTETIILTTSGQNILNCASLNQTSLTYAGTQTATPTPTPAPGQPTATPTPTPTQSGGNTAPSCVTLDASPVTGIGVPLAVTFTCRGTDPDGDITAAEFRFGDETSQIIEKNVGSPGAVSTTHTYTQIGTLGASCRVRDNNNVYTSFVDACRKIITIRPKPKTSATTVSVQRPPGVTPTPQVVALVEELPTPPAKQDLAPRDTPQVVSAPKKTSPFPWWVLALAALVFFLIVLLLKKRKAKPPTQAPPPAQQTWGNFPQQPS
ncbi:hypothetical protein A3A64_02500 [Candidatus Gottesmanbacteria bacterium RIFCSPLOWO2_01_FULL_48_11]|uniref:Cohesin domain-containing protein n=1 Tax=Candidatus Gottesmanbacteria bacterium RIFCSPLOWO2_01_FULL_48_11 TaxID=1798395 RepID=A0A1F6ATU4_9BACT|nr:MAG: hypothetical protein A3A64_02500 [Candidatus Gottesmanbacteria bacterium RIFCSPLOWO2_01_FULL_48_11]